MLDTTECEERGYASVEDGEDTENSEGDADEGYDIRSIRHCEIHCSTENGNKLEHEQRDWSNLKYIHSSWARAF